MSNSDSRNILPFLPVNAIEIIRPEVRCSTKVTNIKCKYIWAIQDFKSICSILGTVLTSPQFSATNDCKWFLEFHSKRRINQYSNNHYYSALYLKPNSYLEISRNGLIAVELKCSIIDSFGEESNIKRNIFPLKYESEGIACGFEEFIKCDDDLLKGESKLLPKNKLTVNCEVTFIKQENIMDVSIPLEMIESNPGEEFGKLFIKEDHSDITIYVNDKKYPAHKSVLAARSSVFEAMLKHNTTENKLNRIDIVDIDEQVFVDALRFIYTGKVLNLETMAFELLAVADKYDLVKLKSMCEQVLCSKMSVETVVRILVAADMYNVKNLKDRAIDYIKSYSIDVANLMDSEAWSDLTSRPHLVKDVLEKYMKY